MKLWTVRATVRSKFTKHILAIFYVGLMVIILLCQGCATSSFINKNDSIIRDKFDSTECVAKKALDDAKHLATKGFTSPLFTNNVPTEKQSNAYAFTLGKKEEVSEEEISNSSSDKKLLRITKYTLYADKVLLACNAAVGQSITVWGSEDLQNWQLLRNFDYTGEFVVLRPAKKQYFWRLSSG